MTMTAATYATPSNALAPLQQSRHHKHKAMARHVGRIVQGTLT